MINPELLDYIKSATEKGQSREAITQALLQNGWASQDISEAFTALANLIPQPSPVPSPSVVSVARIDKLPGAPALLKEAWGIYRQNLGTFLGITSIVFLTTFIFSFVIISGALLASPGKIIATAITIVLFFLIFLISGWGTSALMYGIKDRSENLGIIELYRRGWGKIFSLWWVLLLLSLIALGGFLLFVIPGFIFSVWFSSSVFVLFGEDIKGMNALLRSKEYVKGNWGSVFWRMIFISLVVFIFSFLLGLPLSSVSETSWVRQLSVNALNILLTPFILTYGYLVYHYLRLLKGEAVFIDPKGQKIGFSLVAVLGFLAIPIIIFGFLFLSVKSLPDAIQLVPSASINNTGSSTESKTYTLSDTENNVESKATTDKTLTNTVTIKSGSPAITFTLKKYPANAMKWSLRVKCPDGVGGIVVLTDKRIIKCNESVSLDESISQKDSSVSFGAKLTNSTRSDQTVIISSTTSDSNDVLIGEEKLLVVIKPNIDAYIKYLISNVRVPAEVYYDGNNDSYMGACTSTKIFSNYKSITDIVNELKNLSNSVICKDSPTAWAISAQSKENPSQYFCSDSTGVVIERTSAITATSCR